MTSAVTDFTQFARMRVEAQADDPGVLREVAGQFEAIFVETLFKNMRSSSLGDPIFGQSDQLEMYQGMMDQQLAVELSSGRGIGIADMLVAQLGGESTGRQQAPRANHSLSAPVVFRQAPQAGLSEPLASITEHHDIPSWSNPGEFASQIWPHAERAARKLGVAPEALLAQAALETGWGKHVMQSRDGSSSLNLFGIKAGPAWNGASVAKSTLEFKDGIGRREAAKFRVYPDLAATFDDYATFIAGKPRYASVMGSGQDTGRFAGALQTAGYASDPHYADKIRRILNSDTMRVALKAVKSAALVPIKQFISQVSGR